MYFVYFLRSIRNQKIYVGYTVKEPGLRAQEHNQGANPWTKQNGPFILVYYEAYCCKSDVLNRERFYKTGYGRKIRDAILSVVEKRYIGV